MGWWRARTDLKVASRKMQCQEVAPPCNWIRGFEFSCVLIGGLLGSFSDTRGAPEFVDEGSVFPS